MIDRRKLRRASLLSTTLFGLAWSVALIAGIRTLMSYENSPGTVGTISEVWPAASRISPPNNRPTLVMLAHPQCPCTRASVDELGKIMARVQGKVSPYVLFLKPQGASSEWESTALRRSAARIPGVVVLSDIDGAEARKFGAETSGHTFLYDRNGRLLFSGGITQSRGHAGDNAGENAIVSLVNNHQALLARSFVFGCSLAHQAQKAQQARCWK